MVISPRICKFSKSANRSSNSPASLESGSSPALVSSELSFTSTRTGSRLPDLPAASFSPLGQPQRIH